MHRKPFAPIVLLVVLLLLAFVPPQGYSLTNPVPVANVQITLTYQDGSTLYVTTDSNGEFRGLVRPGLYTNIELSGNTIMPYSVNNVNIDTSNNLLEFAVDSSLWIAGNVVVGGAPAPGIQVDGPTSTITDSNGQYALPLAGIFNPLLSYKVPLTEFSRYWRVYSNLSGVVILQGRLGLVGQPIISPTNYSRVVYYQENPDFTPYYGQEVVQHDVTLLPSLRISGVVTDNFGTPIPNATVTLVSVSGYTPGGYAVTDSQGRYVIDVNVEASQQYYIQAVARGYRLFNTSITPSGNTVFNIQLEPASTVKGHVTNSGGAPLQNILIWAISDSGWQAYALTDSNGYYELPTGFGPGDNLTIYYGDFDLWDSVGMMAFNITQASNLGPGDNTINLVYDMTSITITGQLNDTDRAGLLELPMIEIQLHTNISIPYPLPAIKKYVNPDGTFSIKIPTRISFMGYPIYITSVDVGVDGQYYYPDTPIATGLGTSGDIDLGTIPITSYPLIDVTIRVYVEKSSLVLPDFHHSFSIEYKDMLFNLAIETNSSIFYPMSTITPNNGTILVSLVGPTGTQGYMRLTIPKAFLGPPYTVYIDGVPANYNVILENATHVTIEIIYQHSEHTIYITSTQVIPEFPLYGVTLLVSLFAALIISYIVWRKV